MLRSRVIRPGIAVNEDLAALGPEAILLFERLWMLADREGRVEDRPDRIRAEAFPYWREFPVEKLLEKLVEKCFIVRYTARHCNVIVIPKFAAHQPVHAHEAKSTLPPMPRRAAKSTSSNGNARVRNVDTCRDKQRNVALSLPLPLPNTSGGVSTLRSDISTPRDSPPPNQGRTPQRKPPARESRPPVGPQETNEETRAAPAEIAYLRQSLVKLGREVGMPPPDDLIVQRVYDAGRGANAAAIHEVLKTLYHRGKFRDMRSWGFIPIVLGDCFNEHAASSCA